MVESNKKLKAVNDKYLQYDLEDFLSDDDFINWVLDRTHEEEWSNWLDKNRNNRALVESAKNSINQLKFKETSSSQEISIVKEKVWQRIDQSTETKTIPLVTTRRRRWLYSIAAVAAVTLLGIMIIPEKEIVVTSKMANAELVLLPAESKVMLSPESTISYKSKNWSERRNVQLDGSAEFSVSKGVPFSVLTDNGSVEVLGTEFNVVSFEDVFQVRVTEGRVSATSKNHQKILTAGMAFYKNPKWEGEHAIDKDWSAKEIYFAFEERPLSDVLKAIQFFSGKSIENNGIDTTTSYTGSFDTSEGIEVSLETVLWPLGIEFNITTTSIQLSTRN